MASARQTEANRLNAVKSTGPRTAEGKARSRRNAPHGLTAQEIVIPGEDVAAYQAFRQQLIDDLQPDGSCELDLIERLAATCWRLRRIPRFEATLMAALERSAFYDEVVFGNTQRDAVIQEELDKRTAARWLAFRCACRHLSEQNLCGREASCSDKARGCRPSSQAAPPSPQGGPNVVAWGCKGTGFAWFPQRARQTLRREVGRQHVELNLGRCRTELSACSFKDQ